MGMDGCTQVFGTQVFGIEHQLELEAYQVDWLASAYGFDHVYFVNRGVCVAGQSHFMKLGCLVTNSRRTRWLAPSTCSLACSVSSTIELFRGMINDAAVAAKVTWWQS
jgi:hypothetical protein